MIVLGTMAHPNIVQLVGVSCDDDNRCLMYELMAGGSIADRLALCEADDSQPDEFCMAFSWQDRVQVTTAQRYHLHSRYQQFIMFGRWY